MKNGYSAIDVIFGSFGLISGLVIWGAELDTSVKVTAAIAWILTMAWGAIAMKISGSVATLRNEIVEGHILEMKSDIAEIKGILSRMRSDSTIYKP